ncbi:MAG: L-fuconate dehydratase [Pirellulaceae bacterium]
MTVRIQAVDVQDIRFPTSQGLHGSDAMNPDPDYSAAYVTLQTNSDVQGNGIAFTLGRGTDLCVAAAQRLAAPLIGKSLDDLTANMGQFWRMMTGDSQYRWLGPEKGVIHLATAAIVNAVWDLWAKVEGKPLWKLLADLSPEQIVSCIDFRYLTDVLTPEAALELLQAKAATKADRESVALQNGIPAYTTSAGWLGYADEYIRDRCVEGMEAGWQHFKIKVGANLQQDLHRLDLVRSQIGDDRHLMIDANQVWDVPQAISWMKEFAKFRPLWIEEPTSPDDVLGHRRIAEAIAPIGVASGEMCQNRIMFKQFLQAGAIQFCQIDSCRLGGVNEVLAVLLLAQKFDVPVCPHGGGVGLCEHIQHLSLFDYIAVSGTRENRITEYVDHLHEHFLDPVRIQNAHYVAPSQPGYSIQMKDESLAQFRFPDGEYWK